MGRSRIGRRLQSPAIGALEGNEVSVVYGFGRELQGGLNVIANQLRPCVDDLLGLSPSAMLATITLTGTRVPLMHGSP